MRFATFVFLTIFLFQTSTAYAALPAFVAAGSLRGGASLLLKGGTKGALITGGSAVGGFVSDALKTWCKSNKKACKDKIGDLYDAFFPDDDDDDDCPSGQVKKYAAHTTRYYDSWHSACYGMGPGDHPLFSKDYITIKKREVNKLDWQAESQKNCRVTYDVHFVNKKEPEERKEDFTINSFCVTAKDDDKERDERLKKDLLDALKDKLDDEEFTQIINNYGDKNDFDFVFNNCTGDYSCIEVDKDFADKVNNKDYDSDKMSKDNCEVKNNKIVSCDNAKRTKDDDDKDDKDKKDKDDKKKKDDDDDKNGNKQSSTHRHDDDDDDTSIFCKTSDITKEICEFLDWVDDEPEPEKDTKAKTKKVDPDKSEDVDVSGGCPPSQNITISVLGYSTTLEFDYKPYCDAAKMYKPYILTAGGLVAMYIFGGGNRRG